MIEYKEQKNKEHDSSSEDLTLLDITNDNPESFTFENKKGFVTVSNTTSVKEALEKMKKIPDCQDIFVTENGKETGKVLGWLTDSLINRFLTIK